MSDLPERTHSARLVGYAQGRKVFVPICCEENDAGDLPNLVQARLVDYRQGRKVLVPVCCRGVDEDTPARLVGYARGRKVLTYVESCCAPGGSGSGSGVGAGSGSGSGSGGNPPFDCTDLPPSLYVSITPSSGENDCLGATPVGFYAEANAPCDWRGSVYMNVGPPCLAPAPLGVIINENGAATIGGNGGEREVLSLTPFIVVTRRISALICFSPPTACLVDVTVTG